MVRRPVSADPRTEPDSRSAQGRHTGHLRRTFGSCGCLKDFDFVCKLDADIEFKPNYFADLMKQFAAHPRLGTASGKAYTPVQTGLDPEQRELVLERSRDDFSVGLAKLYRRECFEEIGGFVREVMWDGIDCHRCRQLGWIAVSYPNPELAITHLRLMGSSFRSIYHGRMRWGRGQYFMGTHPLYLLAISVYRAVERPWILGGLCILIGYVGAWLRRAPQFEDREFRRHLHRWQLHELANLLLPRRLRRGTGARTLRKVAIPPAKLDGDAGDIETEVAESIQDLLADAQREFADRELVSYRVARYVIPLMALAVVIAPVVIWILYDPRYDGAGILFAILTARLMIRTIGQIQFQYLMVQSRVRLATRAYFVALAVQAALFMPVVLAMGIVGLALCMLISTTVLTLTQTALLYRRSWRGFVPALCALFWMAAGLVAMLQTV